MIDLAGMCAEHDSQQKMKYQEDLQKTLLILNRPQFIYQLLRSYQKVPKEVKEGYFAKIG